MQNCKFCSSTEVVKHGSRAGIQRYLCKKCNHHFLDNNVHFPRMRVNDHVITTALNLYFDGLSTWKVANRLGEIFGESVSHATVLSWIQKYASLVSAYVKSLQPKLSGKYHHDETEIKIGGEGRYFWEMIDEDTRFLVVHLLTEGRTTENAIEVFQKALETQRPIALFTDGSFAYDKAVNKVFYTRYKANKVEWVRRVGIRARETNNMIERKHGSLKDRLRPARGLKHDETARAWLDGYVINYNFCRVHSTIKQTPAEAAGIEVKGWKQLIERAQIEQTEKEITDRKLEQPIEVRSN
jgi:transposase-like protein